MQVITLDQSLFKEKIFLLKSPPRELIPQGSTPSLGSKYVWVCFLPHEVKEVIIVAVVFHALDGLVIIFPEVLCLIMTLVIIKVCHH